MDKQDTTSVGSSAGSPSDHPKPPIVTNAITWTAIPHGSSGPLAQGSKLYVSVFISPRLTTTGGAATLADCDAWLNWPTTVSKLSYKVAFDGGPTFSAKVVSGTPDLDRWRALFEPSTPIASYQWVDYSKTVINSYPVSRINADIAARYQGVMQEISGNPYEFPTTSQMARQLTDIPTLNPGSLGAQQVNAAVNAALQDSGLNAQTAMPAYRMLKKSAQKKWPIQADYLQVVSFHDRLASVAQEAIAQPPLPMPTVAELEQRYDFHAMISALGNHPALLRLLGLVVDLEVDVLAQSEGSSSLVPMGGSATTVSVIPSDFYSSPPNILTATYYSLSGDGSFVARAVSDSYLTQDLMLQLGNSSYAPASPFEIIQMDVDGASLKMLALAPTVAKQLALLEADAQDLGARVLGGDKGQSLPSLRSAGLSLIHTGRAYDLTQRLARATKLNAGALPKTPPSQTAPANPTVLLHADDLARGYTFDVWDAKTNRWAPLCRRTGTYEFTHRSLRGSKFVPVPDGDEGFVALTTAQVRGSTQTSDMYLHEQVARWHGWSLSAARPVDPNGIPLDKNDLADQSPDAQMGRFGLKTSYTVPAGTLPRLRFGRTYKMRARMMDIAGNVPAFDPNATSNPLAESDEVTYRRWEPLVAPTLMLRQSIDGSPGESMARLVIRSDVGVTVEDYYHSISTASGPDSRRGGPIRLPSGNSGSGAQAYAPNEYAERFFLPPITSQVMAETHGMFDSPPSWSGGHDWLNQWWTIVDSLDQSAHSQAATADAATQGDKQVTTAPVDAHPAETLPLPYMPDPLAKGITFLFLPGLPKGQACSLDWGGTWPFLGTLRLVLQGPSTTGDGSPVSQLAATPRTQALARTLNIPSSVLTVYLPQGQMTTVRYSSLLPTDAANTALSLMALWQWVVQAYQSKLISKKEFDRFGDHARAGLLWLLTPYREITLVHAVQHPLITPAFSKLFRTARQAGGTSAQLWDARIPVSGISTSKIDISAHWYEPTDDVTKPGPSLLDSRAHVSEIPISYTDTMLSFASTTPCNSTPANPAQALLAAAAAENRKHFIHELGNTKYHRVKYTLTATTRYREYFPFTETDIENNPELIAASSDSPANASYPMAPNPDTAVSMDIADGAGPLPLGVLDVPSTARPQSPNLLYVVPAFYHYSAAMPDGSLQSARFGGGLRVYLERPWYSSGEGELLGVVLPSGGNPYSLAPDPSRYTQWGLDPLYKSQSLPASNTACPTVDMFQAAVWTGKGLGIEEQPGKVVDVAAHAVQYDADRRLWYSDIYVSGGPAYYPFVRLALARCQPKSLAGCELSRLVLADFAQLAPDRVVTVAFDPTNADLLNISVLGQWSAGPGLLGAEPGQWQGKAVKAYAGLGSHVMTADVEVQPFGGTDGDLDAWVSVTSFSLATSGSITTGPNITTGPAKFTGQGSSMGEPKMVSTQPTLFGAQQSGGSYALWTGSATIDPPQPPGTPARLVVREYEWAATEPESTQSSEILPGQSSTTTTSTTVNGTYRLVWAEVLDLLLPS